VNSTAEGKACHPWASANAPGLFSDGSIEEADNFCRNPLLPIFGGVYCLRLDDKSNFGFCDTCPGGYEGYNGVVFSVNIDFFFKTKRLFIRIRILPE